MFVALGSQSQIKREALQAVLADFGLQGDVQCLDIPSGQNSQPFGIVDIYEGARARAFGAWRAHPDHFCFGIENGILDGGRGKYFDLAVIVLVQPNGTETLGTSTALCCYPTECVLEAQKRGFATTTVSDIIAKRFGGNPKDPFSFLTGGRYPRREQLIQGIRAVMAQVDPQQLLWAVGLRKKFERVPRHPLFSFLIDIEICYTQLIFVRHILYSSPSRTRTYNIHVNSVAFYP